MATFSISKEVFVKILCDIRSSVQFKSGYKHGLDVKEIRSSYFTIVSLAGSNFNKIDKTKLITVEYENINNELFKISIPFMTVYKHYPNIISIK